jgi:hypothetical protein
MIKKTDGWFWLKMSHAKRGGDATHNRVAPIKMVWLILGTERCGEAGRIDVTPDVHVEVSHISVHDVTSS